MRKIVCIILAAMLMLCGCSDSGSSDGKVQSDESYAENEIDYTNEAEFEAALNRGEDLVGKTVICKVKSLHPESIYGYNIWAGEHLNFIFAEKPDLEEGDEITVKVRSVIKHQHVGFISWIINAPDEFDASTKSSDYTVEKKYDNVSIFLPVTATTDSDGNSTNYHTYEGLITISVDNASDDDLNTNFHTSSFAVSFLEAMGDSLYHADNRFLDSIPVLYYESIKSSEGRTLNTAGILVPVDTRIIGISTTVSDSLRGAQEYLAELIKHMKVNDRTPVLVKASNTSLPETSAPAETTPPPPAETEKLVYNENGLKIYYKGISSKYSIAGIKLYLENSSYRNYTVQAKNVSVNGYSVTEIFSVSVGAGKKAVDSISIYGLDDIGITVGEITDLEFQLEIYDDDDWSSSFTTDIIKISL